LSVFLDKLTDRILIFLCIILLCLGGYALLDTIHIYYHANDTSLLSYKPEVDENGVVRDPLSLPGAVWMADAGWDTGRLSDHAGNRQQRISK